MNSGETKCFQELLDEVRELAVSLAVSQVKLQSKNDAELGAEEASDTSDPEQIPEVCERSPVFRNGWDRARKTVHALGAGSADVTARERSLKLRSRMTIVSAFM